MFGRPIRLGKIFGLTITVSWSFLVLLAILWLPMVFRNPEPLRILLGLAIYGFVVPSSILLLSLIHI